MVSNEQHEHFVCEMRECDLLHETDPSLPCPRLEASLYEYYESSLPLESNVVDDALVTDLGETFDPSLTYLSFVAPSFSSTPMDTSVNDSILLASPLPLAQCTGLEIGENCRGDASSIEDVSLSWLGGLTLVEPYLEEAPFEEFHDDVRMGRVIPSMGLIGSICAELLDSTPISSLFLPTLPSLLHALHKSLSDIRGSYPLFDPYCAYLEDAPRKITWSTFLLMLLIFL